MPALPAGEDLPAVALVNAVLRRRRFVLWLPFVLAVGAGVYSLTRPRRWTSQATFSVQDADSPNRISGLAAQFGIAVGSGEGPKSPAFYVELLRSREIIAAAARDRYDPDGAGPAQPAPLAALFRVRATEPARRDDETVRALLKAVRVTKSRETGIVQLSVDAPSPVLAHDLAARLLSLVDAFNRRSRQSAAGRQRAFVEERLAEARGELRRAEDRLQGFFASNRQYQGSPLLVLEQDRLAREVGLRQQTVLTLAQSHEQARIDEVRDAPAIMIIDEPTTPVRPEPRGAVRNAVFGGAVGLMVALFGVVSAALLRPRPESDAEARAAFAALWRETVADLRRPYRLLRPTRG